jgi:hypothetical protein
MKDSLPRVIEVGLKTKQDFESTEVAMQNSISDMALHHNRPEMFRNRVVKALLL